MSRAGSTSTSRAPLILAFLAVAWAAAAGIRIAWTCDDAFISFRYASHLVEGLGLVYNPGERVEGYSNLSWTLWSALGLGLGADVERWSMAWGVACYAGSATLLAFRAMRRARVPGVAALPIAAWGAAVHPDWNAFATGGLETSAYAFLALLGFVLAVESEGRPRRLAAAGAAFGLAAITRPEGVLLGAVAAAFLAWRRTPPRALAAFGAAWLAPALAQLAFRLAYYGDLLPNTFYAKSAGAAWYAQGGTYVALYFAKYAVLGAAAAVALALVLAALRSHRRADRRATPEQRDDGTAEAALALALAAVQLLFVLRVGGDFMFARLLIPATPFLLILGEIALARFALGRRDLALAGGAAAVLAIGLASDPFEGTVAGIVNERREYPRERCDAQRRKGETLRWHLAGLPVRAAFMGSEARVVYYAEIPVAIECSAGLTDRFIARRPLDSRGRVGHEKRPTAAYLLEERGVQLGLHPGLAHELALGDSALALPIRFGTARACVLRWDPALMAELGRRGARFRAPELARRERSAGAPGEAQGTPIRASRAVASQSSPRARTT